MNVIIRKYYPTYLERKDIDKITVTIECTKHQLECLYSTLRRESIDSQFETVLSEKIKKSAVFEGIEL